MENYVPPQRLADAVTAVHKNTRCTWDGDRYSNPLGPECLHGRKRADKTAVARAVVEGLAGDEWPLDLAARVGEIVEMVRRANDRT